MNGRGDEDEMMRVLSLLAVSRGFVSVLQRSRAADLRSEIR